MMIYVNIFIQTEIPLEREQQLNQEQIENLEKLITCSLSRYVDCL